MRMPRWQHRGILLNPWPTYCNRLDFSRISSGRRKKLHPGYAPRYDTENTYEYRNVTALEWGRQFHAKVFVSEPALKLIEQK